MTKKPIAQRVKDKFRKTVYQVGSSLGFDLTAKFDDVELPIDMDGDTVWASKAQIAGLFEIERSVVSKHLKDLFESGEVERDDSTCAKFAQVRFEGSRQVTREVEHYSLDVILAIGFKTNSGKAIAFRKKANKVLKGYFSEGYALNGDRLNADPVALLGLAQEVRAIRTSEKNLYSQVKEVFKLASIDYDSGSEAARKFFAESQDTFHWAASQETASEILKSRCDASKPNLGITSLGNRKATKSDVEVAKNFMSENELKKMQLIGDAFLGYVEGVALQEKQVSMTRLLLKLQGLVEMYDYPVFPGYAAIKRPTAKQAKVHVHGQYDLFKKNGHQALPSPK